MKNLILIILAIVSVILCNNSTINLFIQDVPIPKLYPGYSIGSNNAPLKLEMFMVLNCPYVEAFFNTSFDYIHEHYIKTNKLQMILHQYPLPYFSTCWDITLTAKIMFNLNRNNYISFIRNVLNNRNLISNDNTLEITRLELFKRIYENFVQKYNFITFERFKYELGTRENRVSCIQDYKFASSKSISGTPQYLFNGVFMNKAGRYTLEEWKEFLNKFE